MLQSRQNRFSHVLNLGAACRRSQGVGHYQQGHWDVAMEHFQKAVKAGGVSRSRLDQAVARVLQLKLKLGLL